MYRGTVSDVAGLDLVGGGSGVSADAVGVLVDVVSYFWKVLLLC